MNSSGLPSRPVRPAVAICCLSAVCGDRPCDQQLNPVYSLCGSPLALLWGRVSSTGTKMDAACTRASCTRHCARGLHTTISVHALLQLLLVRSP